MLGQTIALLCVVVGVMAMARYRDWYRLHRFSRLSIPLSRWIAV